MRLAPAALVCLLAGSAHASNSSCDRGTKPTTLEDWVRQGDCFRDAYEYGAAIGAYWRGLAVRPAGSLDLHLGLAQAYLEQGRRDDMYSSIQAALHLDAADPNALYWLGIYYETGGDYASALEQFRRVITIRPNHVRAQRNIGFVLLQQDKFEEAISALEVALQLDRNDWKAHLNLATAYNEAYKALVNELKAFGTTGSHTVSPREMELPKKMNAIPYRARYVEHSREAARLNPGDPTVQYALGRSLMDEPKTLSEAIEAFKRSAAIRPDYKVLRNLAYAQQQADRLDDAYETAKRARQMSSNDIWLIVLTGQLELSLGRLGDAEKSFRAALQLDARRWDVSVLLGKTLKRLGRAADAQREIDQAKEFHPELTQLIEHSFDEP